MRKIYLSAAFLACLSSFAQIEPPQKNENSFIKKVELAAVVGVGTANYTTTDVVLSNKPLTSVNFGINADLYFSEAWSLKTGLFYQKMGSKYNANKEELNYLTVPLNASWHFGKKRNWNLNFGPMIGFLTTAHYFSSYGTKEDMSELMNKTQVGLNLGIGYKFEVTTAFSLLIETQGMVGLSNAGSTSQVNLRNQYGSFNIGGVYTFGK